MAFSHVGKWNQTQDGNEFGQTLSFLHCAAIATSKRAEKTQEYCKNVVWKYVTQIHTCRATIQAVKSKSKRWEKPSVLPFLACPHELAMQNPKTNTRVNTKHVISAGTHNCAHPAAQCSPSLQEPTAEAQTTPSRK